MINEKLYCHICGEETEFLCEQCGEPVCDNCSVSYTYLTPIDYTLCDKCYEENMDERNKEMSHRAEEEKIERECKDLLNEKRRIWYNSDEQVKKRQRIKEERKEARRKEREEMYKNTYEFINEMFKKL